MHYLAYAIIPEDGDVRQHVASIMAPYHENETEDGIWDWYQIGGRWTGHLDGYDPELDPANQETCPLCHGSGSRNDELEQRARRRDPEYTCNGCQGKGTRTKWPTQWAERDGDTVPLDALPDDKLVPHTLFTHAGVIDKGWSFNEPDFPGWEEEHEDKRNKIEARISREHEAAVKKALADLKGQKLRVVVVDYHS